MHFVFLTSKLQPRAEAEIAHETIGSSPSNGPEVPAIP